MTDPHFIQMMHTHFLPIFADAAGIIFGVITIAVLVIVFIRAFNV